MLPEKTKKKGKMVLSDNLTSLLLSAYFNLPDDKNVKQLSYIRP